jgi:hydroxymethylglutaryl-CoA lyase
VKALLDSTPAVVTKALDNGYRVRGYVSVVMTDPFDGEVSAESVTRVTGALDEMGCYEMSLGDTTGEGDPLRWLDLWQLLKRQGLNMDRIAVSSCRLARADFRCMCVSIPPI